MTHRIALTALLLAVSVSSADAQVRTNIPQSGAANQFMSQIQSQAIGNGFTGASQNSLALSQGNPANVFQGLGATRTSS